MKKKQFQIVGPLEGFDTIARQLEQEFTTWYTELGFASIHRVSQVFRTDENRNAFDYIVEYDTGSDIVPDDLPKHSFEFQDNSFELAAFLGRTETALIVLALNRTNWHVLSASVLLGMSLSDLLEKIHFYIKGIGRRGFDIHKQDFLNTLKTVPSPMLANGTSPAWLQNNLDVVFEGCHKSREVNETEDATRCIIVYSSTARINEPLVEPSLPIQIPKCGLCIQEALNELEKQAMMHALNLSNGHVATACRFLRISRQRFYRRWRELGMMK